MVVVAQHRLADPASRAMMLHTTKSIARFSQNAVIHSH